MERLALVGAHVPITSPACSVEDVRYAAEKYGRVKDVRNLPSLLLKAELSCGLLTPAERAAACCCRIPQVYIPKDYYTGRPRGIAFIEVHRAACAV